jgi:hypothetical protein
MNDQEIYQAVVKKLQEARSDIAKLIGYPKTSPNLKHLHDCYENLSKLLDDVVKKRAN